MDSDDDDDDCGGEDEDDDVDCKGGVINSDSSDSINTGFALSGSTQ